LHFYVMPFQVVSLANAGQSGCQSADVDSLCKCRRNACATCARSPAHVPDWHRQADCGVLSRSEAGRKGFGTEEPHHSPRDFLQMMGYRFAINPSSSLAVENDAGVSGVEQAAVAGI
jgi:hypothetical protein